MKQFFASISIFLFLGLALQAQMRPSLVTHLQDGAKENPALLKGPAPSPFVCATSTLTDYDGNSYNTVDMGGQCWMKENLRTTHYADGTLIPSVLGGATWDALIDTDPAYCIYGNAPGNGPVYGSLYTWAGAMKSTSSSSANPSGVQGACPADWHVPSDAEWKQLEMYIGMSQNTVDSMGGRGSAVGGMLKSVSGWGGSNVGATNGSGFSGLPGAFCNSCGSFFNLGIIGNWWTSTENQASQAYYRKLRTENSNVYRQLSFEDYGFSVRCVYDFSQPRLTSTSVSDISHNAATSGGEVVYDGGQTVSARGLCWNTTGSPTLADSYSTNGDGTGTFSGNLTGLSASTTYYVRAYATNGQGTGYGNQVEFTTDDPPFVCGTSTVADYDGNVYNSVEISTQCWMKENLMTTHYADGTALVDGTAAGNISGNYTTKYWFYPDNDLNNKAAYGLLYSWSGASNGVSGTSVPSGVQGACPTGWHLPSDGEWKAMESSLGMDPFLVNTTGLRGTNQGGRLKETGTLHWTSPNSGATNSTGFSALPGGFRYCEGFPMYFAYNGYWWTASQDTSSKSFMRVMGHDHSQIGRYSDTKDFGFSVRCVRDN